MQQNVGVEYHNTIVEFNGVASKCGSKISLQHHRVLQQKYLENSTIEGLYNTWSYPLNATCSPCHACETYGKPLIRTCNSPRSFLSHLSPFYSHFFLGNTRSFLNSLHLHLWVQHLEEKNPFIPLQGFNHFFNASDSSSTSPQEPKARNTK